MLENEKFKKLVYQVCSLLELMAAALVLVGILLAIVSLLRNGGLFRELLSDTSALKHYLEQIFTIVIGIEFLQMLCRPNSDNVIEILIFLVARHMIVGDTVPTQDFISVISIALLCLLRRWLHVTKNGQGASLIKLRREKPEDESRL